MSRNQGATQSNPTDSDSIDPTILVHDLGRSALDASRILVSTPSSLIDMALGKISDYLMDSTDFLLAENKKDITAARDKSLNDAMIDRLLLTPDRIKAMADGCKNIAELNDPTNKILWETQRPNGLNIQRVSCPIGVLGMIYESRPNVTIDAAALCLKSKNAVILRGGSESFHSSRALHSIITKALQETGLPKDSVCMIPTTDRAAVGAMLGAHEFIDVMIPRGGKNLIERVMTEARMPVFSHLDGICHIYVHDSAQDSLARDIVLNSKMRRTGICGAVETVILDQKLAPDIVKDILTTLLDSGCDIVGDKVIQAWDNRIGAASTEDWNTEYLDSKLSICSVNSVEEAVHHINTHGSHHTDSILAEDENVVRYFQANVDSGIVMHNASTQFADGGEFGMGAEIGIATGKMHARGPVGVEQLCSYKYLVNGNGQTRP